MRKQKFLELASTIEKSESDVIYMNNWFGEIIEAKDYEEWHELKNILAPWEKVSVMNAIELTNLNSLFDDNKIKVNCNTTACIAGWTVVNEWSNNNDPRFKKEMIERYNTSSIQALAKEILGITDQEAQALFYCDEESLWARLYKKYDFEFIPYVTETWRLEKEKVVKILQDIANGKINICEESDDD